MKKGNYKTKKVVRTWTTKHGVRTKVYPYGTSETGYHPGERKRARKAITKYKREGKAIVIDTLGRVRKKALKEVIKRIEESDTIPTIEKETYIEKIKNRQYQLDQLRGFSIRGVMSHFVGISVQRMIYNTGWTPTMLALELNVQYNEQLTGDDITNAANWPSSTLFISPYSQKHYMFKFSYAGLPMHQV